VQAVLADHEKAPLTPKDRELFRLIAKVVEAPHTVTAADHERARAAGWTDEALYDAVTVAALFQFYNTWTDGTGVHEMSHLAFDMMGKRLAAEGYGPGRSLPPRESG